MADISFTRIIRRLVEMKMVFSFKFKFFSSLL